MAQTNQRRLRRSTTTAQTLAKDLRKAMTPAEKVLWERLRNRQLNGIKFRRQEPIGPFIADFYCPAYRLVIEIDGGFHDLLVEADHRRTIQFEEYGYKGIRFQNREIEENIGIVFNAILEYCQP